MNIVRLEFAIVVVGEDCNPTILNPDFLKNRGIVPDEWGWELSGPPITTPPFATVIYDSGITIKVEKNRVQISDKASPGDIGQSKAGEVVGKYISVLPHVRYTAVGINFRSLVEINDPETYLKDRFLNQDALEQGGTQPSHTNLTFVYPHDDGKLTLSIEAGVIERGDGETIQKLEGITASGNYHRDCQGYPTDKQVLAHIAHAPEDSKHFSTVLRNLLADTK